MTCRVVGHRGAAHLAPENTLASFALAENLGVDELELDLRLSSDREIVVIHDATLGRTTDGVGEVASMSVAEIQALDAGRGQRIPTFDEVLGGTELPLQVEIKDPGVLEPLTHVLAEVPAERERITLTTFDVVVAAQLRDLFDDVPVGLIVPEPTQDLLELALGMGLAGAFGRIENTSQEYIAMAQEAGLRVDVWPVNDPAAVQRALELGADGFTTDDPHVVERAGYSLRRKPAGSG